MARSQSNGEVDHIVDAAWHRNGIGGVGFYAIIFEATDGKRMIASLFDEPGYCAVYDIKELDAGNITFACGNSWRGDVFEAELRPMLDSYLASRGTNRLGPFSVTWPDLPTAPRP